MEERVPNKTFNVLFSKVELLIEVVYLYSTLRFKNEN